MAVTRREVVYPRSRKETGSIMIEHEEKIDSPMTAPIRIKI